MGASPSTPTGEERRLTTQEARVLDHLEPDDQRFLSDPLSEMLFDIDFLDKKHHKFNVHTANWGPYLQLPPGWVERLDPKQHRFYFFHEQTQTTTWIDPRESGVGGLKKTGYSPLPAGWEERLDPRTGRVFFAEKGTGRTQWQDPRATAAADDESDEEEDEEEEEEEGAVSDWNASRDVVEYVTTGLLEGDRGAQRAVLTGLLTEGGILTLPIINNDATIDIVRLRLGLLSMLHVTLTRDRQRARLLDQIRRDPPTPIREVLVVPSDQPKYARTVDPELVAALNSAAQGKKTQRRVLCFKCGPAVSVIQTVSNHLLAFRPTHLALKVYATEYRLSRQILDDGHYPLPPVNLLHLLHHALVFGSLADSMRCLDLMLQAHRDCEKPEDAGVAISANDSGNAFLPEYMQKLESFHYTPPTSRPVSPATQEDRKFDSPGALDTESFVVKDGHKSATLFGTVARVLGHFARISSEAFRDRDRLLFPNGPKRKHEVFMKPLVLDVSPGVMASLASMLEIVVGLIMPPSGAPLHTLRIDSKSLDAPLCHAARAILRLIRVHLFFAAENGILRHPRSLEPSTSSHVMTSLRASVSKAIAAFFPPYVGDCRTLNDSIPPVFNEAIAVWVASADFFFPTPESQLFLLHKIFRDLVHPSGRGKPNPRSLMAEGLAQRVKRLNGPSYALVPRVVPTSPFTDPEVDGLVPTHNDNDPVFSEEEDRTSPLYKNGFRRALAFSVVSAGISGPQLLQSATATVIRDLLSRAAATEPPKPHVKGKIADGEATLVYDYGSGASIKARRHTIKSRDPQSYPPVISCLVFVAREVLGGCQRRLSAFTPQPNIQQRPWTEIETVIKGTAVFSILPPLIGGLATLSPFALILAEELSDAMIGLFNELAAVLKPFPAISDADLYTIEQQKMYPKPTLGAVYKDQPWLVELLRQVGWLASKYAATLIAGGPIEEGERQQIALLRGRVFTSGLEGSVVKEIKLCADPESLAVAYELISDAELEGLGEQDGDDAVSIAFAMQLINARGMGGTLDEWMQKHVMELRMARLGGEKLDQALRAITAVILKLNGLLPDARSAATALPQDTPSDRLQQVWKTANKFRQWAIQQRQHAMANELEFSYDVLAGQMTSKAMLLLKLAPGTGPAGRQRGAGLLVRLATSTGMAPWAQEFKHVLNIQRVFQKWRAFRRGPHADVEGDLQSLTRSLSVFIQGDVEADQVADIMLARTRRAHLRHRGLELFCGLLGNTNMPSVHLEVLWHLSHCWSAIPLETRAAGHHYFDHLGGCGVVHQSRLRASFATLLKQVSGFVSDKPNLLVIAAAINAIRLQYRASDDDALRQSGLFESLMAATALKAGVKTDKFVESGGDAVGRADGVESGVVSASAISLLRAVAAGVFDITVRTPQLQLASYPRGLLEQILSELESGAISLFHPTGVTTPPSFCTDRVRFYQLLSLAFTVSVNSSVQKEMTRGRWMLLLFDLLESASPRVQRLALRLLRRVLPMTTPLKAKAVLEARETTMIGNTAKDEGLATALLEFAGRLLVLEPALFVSNTYPYGRLVRLGAEAVSLIRVLLGGESKEWRVSVSDALSNTLMRVPDALTSLDPKGRLEWRVMATLGALGGRIEGFRIGGRVACLKWGICSHLDNV